MCLGDMDHELSPEALAWLEHDNALRARARGLADRLGRDAEDMYKTLKQLERSPSERLALGLRHARLRRTDAR